jgi:hypothetical protein
VTSDRLVSSLTSILSSVGYVGRSQDGLETTEWKATYLCSPSYMAEIKYGSDITSPTLIAEKPLNWISATLLSGERFLDTDPSLPPTNDADFLIDHDLRFKVQTSQALGEDHPMYQPLFPPSPSTTSSSRNRALFTLDPLGNPIPRDDKVSFIRKIKSRLIFDFASPQLPSGDDSTPHPELKVRAVLSNVDHFLGEGLKQIVPGYDLTLHVDVNPLLGWIEGAKSDEVILSWLEGVLDHMLLVSDTFKNHQIQSREW